MGVRALCRVVLAVLVLGGCAPRSMQPVTTDEAARLRERCPPGSFLGTMTVNCPDIVR